MVLALRSNPSCSLVVVATLALGIAANSLNFSFMNPYLIRELPFGHPHQLAGGKQPYGGRGVKRPRPAPHGG